MLQGRCFEHEWIPFKAFENVAAELALHLLTHANDILSEPLNDGACLPQLRPVLRVGDDKTNAGPEVRSRGVDAFARLLRRLSAHHKVVVVLDDLQWSDSDSTELLSLLLTGDSPPPVVWVCATRLDPSEEPRVGSWPDATTIRPGPLADDDARAFVAKAAPGGTPQGIHRAVAPWSVRPGNPG